jgi:hypothetical protein
MNNKKKIYKIIPIEKTNSAILTFQQNIKKNDDIIKNESIEWEYNDKKIDELILDIDNKFELYLKVYRCNISEDYIINENINMPILYMVVNYKDKLYFGNFFDIYVFFVSNEKIDINNNEKINGNYIMKFIFENNIYNKRNKEIKINNFINLNDIIKKMIFMLNSEEMISIYNVLFNEIKKNRQNENKFDFSLSEPTKKYISKNNIKNKYF